MDGDSFRDQPEWVIVVEPCYLESYGLCILMIAVLEAAPPKKKKKKKKKRSSSFGYLPQQLISFGFPLHANTLYCPCDC